MITRREAVRTSTSLIPDSVTCDRCGNKAKHGSGFVSSDYPFEGIYARGVFFPQSGNSAEMERIEIELCGPCSHELVEWVGEGAYVGTKWRDP